jgi:histidine triad (HIT) family protein
MSCVFCEIVAGNIPCEKVYENDKILAFRDIHPQSPVHILVVPKEHIANVLGLNSPQGVIEKEIFHAVQTIASEQNIVESGFRLVINTGSDAGQEVEHLHIHMLGGRKHSWPAG